MGQTTDETFFSGSGYPMVRYNEYRILGEHPPLTMQLGALPLLFYQPHYPIHNPIYIGSSREIDISKMGAFFLYKMGNDPYLILFLQRLPIILITVVLGLTIWKCGMELYGSGGAICALALFASCPNILAHGSLYTSDMGLTAFFFLTIYRIKKFFDSPTFKNASWIGVSMGLALLSKISSIILLPIVFILIFIVLINHKLKQSFLDKLERPCLILAILMFLLSIGEKTVFLFLAPLSLAVIASNLSYKIDWNEKWKKILFYLSVTTLWIIFLSLSFMVWKKYQPILGIASLAWSHIMIFLAIYIFANRKKAGDLILFVMLFGYIAFIAFLVVAADYTDFYLKLFRLEPFEHYVRTFHIAMSHSLSQHKTCLDHSFVTCDQSYFLKVILIKTPILTLILCGLGIIFFTKHKISNYWKFLFFFPPLLFLLFASFVNQVNIGLRHILPIYPFIFLISGMVFAQVNTIKTSWLKQCLVGMLLIGFALTLNRNFRIAPDFICYFNELVGEVRNGSKIVADSNIAWGQNNRLLAEYVKEKNIPFIHVAIAAVNDDELNYHNIKWALMDKSDFYNPKPGYYAIDLIYLNNYKDTPLLKNLEPIGKIGNLIFLYKY